ncbi:MAG: LuxR C-terminal-related transcriptional regulator [Caldilineaceae bacterium]
MFKESAFIKNANAEKFWRWFFFEIRRLRHFNTPTIFSNPEPIYDIQEIPFPGNESMASDLSDKSETFGFLGLPDPLGKTREEILDRWVQERVNSTSPFKISIDAGQRIYKTIKVSAFQRSNELEVTVETDYEPAFSIYRRILAAIDIWRAEQSEPTEMREYGHTTQANAPLATLSKLSEQEKNIFELVRAGKNRQDIADDLAIAVNTVDAHIQHISEKLCTTRVTKSIPQLRKWLKL